jgi:hypothetical protein
MGLLNIAILDPVREAGLAVSRACAFGGEGFSSRRAGFSKLKAFVWVGLLVTRSGDAATGQSFEEARHHWGFSANSPLLRTRLSAHGCEWRGGGRGDRVNPRGADPPIDRHGIRMKVAQYILTFGSVAIVAALFGWAFPATPAQRPNILFIMSDDHAAHAIGAYGSRVNRADQILTFRRWLGLFRLFESRVAFLRVSLGRT